MIKKHSDIILAGFWVLCLVMYDVAIEVLLNILHVVFELLHLGFEWFELGIEHAVEHLFHTSRHGSQIVTFYILMGLVAWFGYRLWRFFPRLYKKLVESVRQAWERRKTACLSYWSSLTVGGKLKLYTSAVSVACLASFFMM